MSSDDSVSYDTIETDDAKFAVLTLTPASSKHLFSKKLISDFREGVQQAVNDKVKGLITTHDGEWFSGGFDYQSATQAELAAAFAGLIADLIQLPFPTVAYVTGRAYGAGFTLALAHDYLVLSNDIPVSLRQDELANGHELPQYAVALVRDKFPLLVSLALLVLCTFVEPPHFAPISDYVNPYVGWTKEQVVGKLLEPMVGLVGTNYSKVREVLLPLLFGKVKPELTRG